MLNETRVLNYIKQQLGHPFVNIEFEDDTVINYVKEYTLREWSRWIPQVKILVINADSTSTQVPGMQGEYYLVEPEGKEILGVKDVYFSASSLYYFGHPPFGSEVFTSGGGAANSGGINSLKDWALSVETAGMMRRFSAYDYTFEFKHPNILRVSPSPASSGETYIAVEYERMQPDDFSGIPNEFQMLFMELAAADIFIVLGRIRKKYGDGQLRTPFGEIPLGAEILDEGKEKRREIIEKLEQHQLPNVVIDFG